MSSKKSYFLALRLPADVTTALEHIPTFPNGHTTPPENLHLTLRFLGSLSAETAAQMAEVLHTVYISPFELELNKVDYFAEPKTLWVGPSAMPPELAALHEEIEATLAEHNLSPKRPAPATFTPHVTLCTPLPNTTEAEMKHWRHMASHFPSPPHMFVTEFEMMQTMHVNQQKYYQTVENFDLSPETSFSLTN